MVSHNTAIDILPVRRQQVTASSATRASSVPGSTLLLLFLFIYLHAERALCTFLQQEI
jgi:hypothetical protein